MPLDLQRPTGRSSGLQDTGPTSWPKEHGGRRWKSKKTAILGIASVSERREEEAKGVSRIEVGEDFIGWSS